MDLEKLPSVNAVRWKNYAMWKKMEMINEEYLNKDSPYGIWEISEKGREYYSRQKQN